MRIEFLPVIFGVLVALLGIAILADAWGSSEYGPMRERRRRRRATLDHKGETLVGFGFLCIAAALIGRDRWRYETLSMLTGAVLVVIGAVANRRYIQETLLFRGPARRGLDDTEHDSKDAPPRRLRIR